MQHPRQSNEREPKVIALAAAAERMDQWLVPAGIAATIFAYLTLAGI